jgi:hypothetical protein
VIAAEVILQEPLIDLLDDGVQPVVGGVECELRIGVPGRGKPACRNSRHASASRICEGSLYIDLRLTHVIPASRPASPEESSSVIFHDLFGVRRVLLPLLTREKSAVLNATALGARAGNVPVAGRVGTPYIQPRTRRRFGLARQHIGRRRETRNVEHVHVGGEELVLGLRCLPRLIHSYSPDDLANRQERRHRGRRGYLTGDGRGRSDTPCGVTGI